MVSHPATSVSVVRKSASISVQLKIAYNSFSDINYIKRNGMNEYDDNADDHDDHDDSSDDR